MTDTPHPALLYVDYRILSQSVPTYFWFFLQSKFPTLASYPEMLSWRELCFDFTLAQCLQLAVDDRRLLRDPRRTSLRSSSCPLTIAYCLIQKLNAELPILPSICQSLFDIVDRSQDPTFRRRIKTILKVS